jgi:ubiquinone/menaquinone biosynthesis C-methylase UbiE
MQRIPEPELMTDEAQCQAYALADFAASNQAFVDIVKKWLPIGAQKVLDIGCGPADVMIRLALACPSLQITAVDGSAKMIELAEKALADCRLPLSVSTLVGYVPGLPLPDGDFDVVLSKDFLHHLPDPMALWQEIRRLARPGAFICVMDLYRPASTSVAHQIVDRVAGNEAEVLKIDFYNSLLAAFTSDEIRQQLQAADLDLNVTLSGDRHLLIQGFITQGGLH